MKYKVGDKVRIVSKWGLGCYQNSGGRMDKWLGKVMTIRSVSSDDYRMEEDYHEHYGGGWSWNDACIAGLADKEKIIVTTDGAETTARMYRGKEFVKSAKAKCSPHDTFDFKTGAALAMDRLLDRETKEEPAAFDKAMLIPGRFGRMSDGDWFIVVDDRFIYLDQNGGFDRIRELGPSGTYFRRCIDCIVEAVSAQDAKQKARSGNFIWVRPGAKFD